MAIVFLTASICDSWVVLPGNFSKVLFGILMRLKSNLTFDLQFVIQGARQATPT
jgi:hypothetical protein